VSRYSPYQFALFRIALGVYLVFHLCADLPWVGELFGPDGLAAVPELVRRPPVPFDLFARLESTGAVTAVLVAMAALALSLALGMRRRPVALALWFLWASLYNHAWYVKNFSVQFVGWMLLLAALVPAGEGLSWRRLRAERGWRMPRLLFHGAWLVLAVGYSYSGYGKWVGGDSWRSGEAIGAVLRFPASSANLLRDAALLLPDLVLRLLTWAALAGELLFLPLALFRRTRALAWSVMMAMHVGIFLLIEIGDAPLVMFCFHLLVFDPAWLAPKRSGAPLVVYFDGYCGLCNGFVDWAMGEDRGRQLRFATLQGEHAKGVLSESDRTDLRSVIVSRGERVWRRSDAIVVVLAALGGLWRALSWGRALPRALRDAAYRLVATHRYRIFGKRDTCRLPTAEEREVFLP